MAVGVLIGTYPCLLCLSFFLTFFELLSEYAFFMDVWLNTLLFDK